MKQVKSGNNIKNDRFPPTVFASLFGGLLLMSGVHVGIIVGMNKLQLNEVIQTIIPIIYWGLVSLGLTLLTRYQIRKTYEEPLWSFAEASRKVAKGDFSVYLPTIHTSDKLDYLDLMILDFNKMVEELGSIETLKTDFISNVSHEMKTPLAVIKNYSQLLKKSNLTEADRQEYTQIISESVDKMNSLVSNILKLNKLENQTIKPEYEKYDLCQQLCDCILQFEKEWDSKNIDLEADMENEALIEADKNLIELVWNNLLSNAIKFTELNGKITVRQKTFGDKIIISIADSGCGMDEETRKHIFDKFYQGDTSHAKEGNGLGLALVVRILELMDFDIKVESEIGKGSKFMVSIPK